MNLVPTPDEQDLVAMLRDLFTHECSPELVRRLGEPGAERFPKSLWEALVSAGVLGLPFPEEHGGAGGGLDDLGVFHVEAGRALCPTVVQSTLAFGIAVDRLGTEDQRARYLAPLCAGDLRASVALWNPSDAGDLRPALQVHDAEDGTGAHLVSGTLSLVPDADLADVLLVSAVLAVDGAPDAVVGLVVDTADPGVRVDPVPTIEGRGSFRVVLDRAAVPEVGVLCGTRGTGLAQDDLRWVAHSVTALQCLEMVGVADAALTRTVGHTTSRHQFGRPIGSFQAVQHIVADMHISVQAARLLARSAVFWLDRGGLATRQTAAARVHATEAVKQVTLDAHQLHGGMGYVVETDLHLWSARARSLATLGGTADDAARWLEREVGLVR